MKIATYNVWNEEEGVGSRFEQLMNEITTVDADIIALQEVTTQFYMDATKCLQMYQYSEYRNYFEENEGLAILSKYPLENCVFLHEEEAYCHSNALNVQFQVENVRFSLTNVHLPWESIKIKEEQIIAIDRFMHEQNECAHYCILLGDFNCDISSSVHRFLVGDQTLYGNDAKPYWLDVAGNFTTLNGMELQPTLDCIDNPRWKGKNTIYAPENFDRIYILDNWNFMSFADVQIFGTEVSPVTNLCASDHYGVVANVLFGG
ncbi:MAG: endonuclease/exonuclease/phosphatase family protein [Lachnospiraceae bacterium]|nr:endonuclease/exonuclease/phosphatase family protein [Lachnospiraceae bacterium]